MKKFKLKLKKGALHQDLGVPQDEKIPPGKLAAATHSPSKVVRKRAIMAKNMKSWAK